MCVCVCVCITSACARQAPAWGVNRYQQTNTCISPSLSRYLSIAYTYINASISIYVSLIYITSACARQAPAGYQRMHTCISRYL